MFIVMLDKVFRETKPMTSRIRGCLQTEPYSARTGDIVMMQFRSQGISRISGFEGVPTHLGIVWVRNNEVLVVENTPFSGPPMADLVFGRSYETHQDGAGGVRVVRLSDLLNAATGFLAVRSLKSGLFNEAAFEREIISFGQGVNFDTKRVGIMSQSLQAGFVFLHSFPPVGEALFRLNDLGARDRKEQFCSEFVSSLLQRLGHIDPDFKKHWSIAPLHFSSGAGTIDALSAKGLYPLVWGEDQPLTCPHIMKSVLL